MVRQAQALREQQKQRPLDDEELLLLKLTEPTLRRVEQREAELDARRLGRP
jgi:hypothetical protein